MNDIVLLSQLIIFLPIIVSIFIYVLNKEKFTYSVFITQGIMTYVFYKIYTYVLANGVVKFTLGGWSKVIGIEFKIDTLSIVFMSMALIIWWVVMIYAWHQKKSDFKFWFFLMFLEGCFLAFVQANDLFTIFILIEIITILSAILILYKKDGISLKAGLYYLLFNSIGMIIYLFGVALLYLKVGTLNISMIKAFLLEMDYVGMNYSIIQLSFACFVVSMCVKAALFPVYDWLPRAHTAAPSHISALLSGLLVKSGLYGLMRILDLYEITSINTLLFYLGFFTAISGILFAISQKDIKGILAFHTISQIGLILMSIASGNVEGIVGASMHIFNHFLFKSLLFLGAGIIINEYGYRRVTEIHGIGRAHPLLTACMFVGIFSITGAPLFVGFLSKTMIKLTMTSALHINLYRIISLGTMISFIKFSKIFFGEPSKYKKINPGKQIGVLIMAVLCILFFFIEIDLVKDLMQIENALTEGLTYNLKYLSKSLYDNEYALEYLIYLAFAFLIYKVFVRPNSKFLHAIRHFRFKFQDAIVSLLLFLGFLIYYL